MADPVYKVLFLCTSNSARSVLAEALLNQLGQGRFQEFSAGSHPKGQVHPLALRLFQERGIPVDGLRSKDWEEFAVPGAPAMDLIVTVCDNAAGEVCPVWPGHPVTAHWGVADPAAFEGSDEEKRRFFLSVYRKLENRIRIFIHLDIDALDSATLSQRLEEIGHTTLSEGSRQ